MAKKKDDAKAGAKTASGKLPVTSHTGVNAAGTRVVIVSALLEVTGQVRFGDGTDIATTITEKDVVLGPDGGSVEKAVWAGTKRRGVDRRTIHELRDRAGWDGADCYVPKLCGMCPVCWLFGFTGTTQEQHSVVKGINAKSRILYATSLSVQDTAQCLNRHSRNQVDEKAQITAGSAGIHEEEVIVGGTRFPTYTSLIRVADWEIGAFAHAFLENLNSNRYTAASRGQGGMKLVDLNDEPTIVVDESPLGVFPFAAPKVPAYETDLAKSSGFFMAAKNSALSLQPFQAVLEAQGFAVEAAANKLAATGGNVELVVEADGQCLIVHQGSDELMKRYYGSQAVGYLRQKQFEFQKKLADSAWRDGFRGEVTAYANALQKKGGDSQTTEASDVNAGADTPNSEDGDSVSG
jgi:CRISPR type I-D-associated protein Csc2